MKESQLQQAIKDSLALAGFTVLHTSAHRQKGPSGVSPGVPDLLVTHDVCRPNWILIEVKTDKGRLSPAQKALADKCLIYVARSPVEAVDAAFNWIIVQANLSGAASSAKRQAERVLESLKGQAVRP